MQKDSIAQNIISYFDVRTGHTFTIGVKKEREIDETTRF